jgi:glutamate racemase
MIGILDSGLGGLTVIKALQGLLTGYDMVYFGDTARAPYGQRSAEKIIHFSDKAVSFLLSRGATLIVIACSTISSIAATYFQRTYRLPVLNAVEPVVSLSVKRSRSGRIGVIGTSATIVSGAHEAGINAVDPQARVYSSACRLLVPIIEAGRFRRPEVTMIIKKYLHPLKMRNVDTLIMGCNHYTLIRKNIQRKVGKRIALIDPVPTLAESVQQYLLAHEDIERSLGKNSICRYYVSDITDDIKRQAMQVFKCNGMLEMIPMDA